MDRERISNVLYPSILKIETSDDESFLCELYEDVIDDFIEELERAKKKIELLKSTYVRS